MRFLDHKSLGNEIARLLEGRDVRCAVAFWGIGSPEHLLVDTGALQKARIVCDISMGATHPTALCALGAPTNTRLKHLTHLHAKVYISDRGAIVCSANASNNGLGFEGVAKLVEAGTFVSADSEIFAEVGTWFEQIWRRATAVDETALEEADEAWKRRLRGRSPHGGPAIPGGSAPSLIGTVATNPERFRGVGFVFTTGSATRDDLNAAREERLRQEDKRPQNQRLSKAEKKELRSWRQGDLFNGWSEEDISAWPRRFVCIHRPGERSRYYFYQRVFDVVVEPDNCAIFAERPKGLKKALGFTHGTEAMLNTDEPLLARIFAHIESDGHRLCESGEHLLRLIDELS